MRTIQSNKWLEGALFVAFAFAVWFAMRVANTKVSKQINIELVATGRGIEGKRWLSDSTAEIAVTIEASGLDALFMQKFDRRKVVFKSSDFVASSASKSFVLRPDIQAILREQFGSGYSYILSTDTVVFPSEKMLSARKKVRIQSEESITKGIDARWVKRPKLEHDSITIFGPKELVETCEPYVEMPKVVWQGALTLELPLLGIERSISTDQHWIKLVGEAAQWAEQKVEKTIVYQNKSVSVELWVSGPLKELAQDTFEESIALEWRIEGERLRIDPFISNPNMVVLSYSPKYLQL
jgi:hypothetical protein